MVGFLLFWKGPQSSSYHPAHLTKSKHFDHFEIKLMPIFLLYVSSYRSIKNLTPLLQECERKTGSVLTLLFTYLHQNLFNIKKYLALVLFCVFQNNLNKAVGIFCTL